MAIPTQATDDREDRALDRKIEQFKGDKPVLDGLIRTYVEQVNDWELAFWEVINERLLENAIGAQLDIWGKLVGEPREFRTDEDFKIAIRLRLRVQRSQGKTQDVLEVTSALLGATPWTYRELYLASFIVEVANLEPVFLRTLARALSRTRPLGVGGMLLFTTWDSSEDFLYGSTYDAGAGQLGFGSLYDPDVGGKFASIRLLTQAQ
jgi:hypothetical protein